MDEIKERVFRARQYAEYMRRGVYLKILPTKPHFMLRVKLGNFTGRPLWMIGTSPETVRCSMRYNDSGDAIRAMANTQQIGRARRPLVDPGFLSGFEPVTLPSPAVCHGPHQPNCPCGVCSGKAYRNSTM